MNFCILFIKLKIKTTTKRLFIIKEVKGQPTLILATTVKGKGVSFMENNYAWHGSAPNTEQYEIAMKELEA